MTSFIFCFVTLIVLNYANSEFYFCFLLYLMVHIITRQLISLLFMPWLLWSLCQCCPVAMSISYWLSKTSMSCLYLHIVNDGRRGKRTLSYTMLSAYRLMLMVQVVCNCYDWSDIIFAWIIHEFSIIKMREIDKLLDELDNIWLTIYVYVLRIDKVGTIGPIPTYKT